MSKKDKIKWSDRNATWKAWFIAGWLQAALILIVVTVLLIYYFNK